MVWLDCLRVHENVLMATSFFSKKKKNLATSLMYSIVYTIEWLVQERISQLIRWTMPIDPYIKLNTDGNAIANLGLAGI